ncbi:hypothetical protein [Embleya sp. AB8]|uniref:hypothetical protein n=1 Tax=Embleya sp. AB8 TaxID=3156304 RepID=UPI003C744EAB
MRICRTRLTRDYVQVPNNLAQDDRLTHMARGCLVDILSRPDGWRITADEMWAASKRRLGQRSPGRRVFRLAWAELKEHGYLEAEVSRLDGGRFGTELTARNIPVARVAAVPDRGSAAVVAPVEATRTDVPPAGTPVRPSLMDVSAGQADVPHGGTSTTENDLEKKTVKTPTTGRRPSNVGRGARSSGCAAAGSVRDLNVGMVGAIIGRLPADLRKLLPELLPDVIANAIRAELDRDLTVEQLTARADRRWFNHGYAAADPELGGPGIRRPVGVAVALVRRGNCASARCDDGTDLDTESLCRTCEREAEDRRATQQPPAQVAFGAWVPSSPWTVIPVQHTPARRKPGWLPLVTCDRCDRAHRSANRGDLCRDCQQESAALAELAVSSA